jgi:transposase-like protein
LVRLLLSPLARAFEALARLDYRLAHFPTGKRVIKRVHYVDACVSLWLAGGLGIGVCDHRQIKGLNNRAENLHQPIRRRERIMKRFKSARHVQKFTSIHDPIYNLHYFPHNQLTSYHHRQLRQAAAIMWREIAELKSA